MLVHNWSHSRSAAFDLKVINPLFIGSEHDLTLYCRAGRAGQTPPQKMTFPVQREVGYVWRYLVAGENTRSFLKGFHRD